MEINLVELTMNVYYYFKMTYIHIFIFQPVGLVARLSLPLPPPFLPVLILFYYHRANNAFIS